MALCAEYFRRLDVDEDQSLSLDEFPFQTKDPSALDSEIYVQYADGNTIKIAIPDYPNIGSPRISPDGKWIAADGWKRGQLSSAAHVLIASLETDEVRDLGSGCMPNWSHDGRRIAYCKYSGGLFVRDVNANGDDEELIDRSGWAIQYSTDGQNFAYIVGGNIAVRDVKTGEKRFLFPNDKLIYNGIQHNPKWSPDSQRICFIGLKPDGSSEIGVVSATGNDPKLKVRGNAEHVIPDFAWHPDGKQILCSRGLPGQKCQLYEFDPDTDAPLVRYPRQPRSRNNKELCWSRDGKALAFVSKR